MIGWLLLSVNKKSRSSAHELLASLNFTSTKPAKMRYKFSTGCIKYQLWWWKRLIISHLTLLSYEEHFLFTNSLVDACNQRCNSSVHLTDCTWLWLFFKEQMGIATLISTTPWPLTRKVQNSFGEDLLAAFCYRCFEYKIQVMNFSRSHTRPSLCVA